MTPTTRVQVRTTDGWTDLELPFDRLPGMVRVAIDGVTIDVVRRDDAADIVVNPTGTDGNVSLDVRGVTAHEMQAFLRVAASRKPAGLYRDDEGHLL